MSVSAVVALASRLIGIDTVGRNESAALDVLEPLLEGAGLAVTRQEWAPGRANLVATWAGGGGFVLSGHVDTVPFGAEPWRHEPLTPAVDGDRLIGRGSSDMKGGLAAIVLAAVDAARRGARGFTVVLTGGEETGCDGARALRDAGLAVEPSVLVIGESTGNEVRLGHKGATWLEVTATGTSAHGSRPELGVNAIETLADAIVALRGLDAGDGHPQLGSRTTNVGTVSGGSQTNLVPDAARMSVDVRPVPGADAAPVRALLAQAGAVETLLDLPSVWSPADAMLTDRVRAVVAETTGRASAPTGVSYFTDAAVLDPSLRRSYILGPGDPTQPHTRDEWVSIPLLEESERVYGALLDAWTAGRLD